MDISEINNIIDIRRIKELASLEGLDLDSGKDGAEFYTLRLREWLTSVCFAFESAFGVFNLCGSDRSGFSSGFSNGFSGGFSSGFSSGAKSCGGKDMDGVCCGDSAFCEDTREK